MKLFKRQRLVFFLLLLVVFLPGSSFAEDVSSTVEKKEESVGRVILEQKKYPLDHYKLEADIGDGLQATGDRALHSMNNALWGFNKTVASFTLFAIDQLMSFDLIGLIAQEAGEMSERIYDLMVGTFLSLFVVTIGGTAAYRFYVNQQAGHAVKAILGSLLIMVFTFWFYEDATGNIVKLNEWGADMEGIASSANVLMTSENFHANEAYDAQEGTAVLENQLFQLMVKRPYLLLNYGSTNETEVNKDDPNRVENLLKIKPYTEEGKEQRKVIIKKEVTDFENKQMSPDYSGERFGNILITILSTFALSIPVLLLASFKFLLQVWFLALVIFTAIPLVISLIPSYSETAIHHFKKVIGVLLMKGGLVLLTAVITGLVTLLYESVKMTDGIEGYAFVVFLIVLVIWGLMQYRSEIFEVASAGVIQGQQMAERMTFATADKLGDMGPKGVKVPARMAVKGANFLSQKRREAMFSRDGEVKESSKRQPQSHSVPRSEKRQVAGGLGTVPKSASRMAGEGVVHLEAYKKGKGEGVMDPGTARTSVPSARNPQRPPSESRKASMKSEGPKVTPSSSQRPLSKYRDPASTVQRTQMKIDPNKPITRYEAQKQIDASRAEIASTRDEKSSQRRPSNPKEGE